MSKGFIEQEYGKVFDDGIIWRLGLFLPYFISGICAYYTRTKILLISHSFWVLFISFLPLLKKHYEGDRGHWTRYIGYVFLFIAGAAPFFAILAQYEDPEDTYYIYKRSMPFEFGYTLWALSTYCWPTCLAFLIGYRKALFEGSMMLIMHIKYAFKTESVEEAILRRKEKEMEREKKEAEREKEGAYQKRVKEFENEMREKDKTIEEDEKKLAGIYGEYPEVAEEVPQILDYLSEELKYKGYWQEVERRFQEGQIRKSIERRRKAVEAAKHLIQEIAEVRRAKADLHKAFYESEAEERKLRVKKKRMEQGEIEEQAELEMDIQKLELEKEKMELEEEIENTRARGKAERAKLQADMSEVESKAEAKVKAKSLSPGERILQSTSDRIEMLKAKDSGLKMAVKAREEELSKFHPEKDAEIYQKVKRMWNDFIMDLMEK